MSKLRERVLRGYRESEGGFSYFNVLLTNKQARDPGFLENNSTQWDIGFIHPKRIPSYYCNKCGEDIDKPPKIEVVISQMAGDQLSTAVVYTCTECKEFINHVHIKSPKGINPKFIRFDETGDYKIPTTEDVETRVEMALKHATEAKSYRDDLELALRWGKKISHKIPMSRIKGIMRTYWSSHLRELEEGLPGLVEEIKKHSYGFNTVTSEPGETTAFEGTGMYEMFERLEETLLHTELPDDVGLNQDILRILVSYKTMFQRSVANYEEHKRQIDECIAAEENNVAEAENKIVRFLNKAKLTESHKNEAMEPLPWDYD